MKNLLYILITGAICWILSDLMEITLKEDLPATLWLTAIFHFLIAVGIWGSYQGKAVTKLSLIATGMTSLGYFIFVYPQIAILVSPSLTFVEFLEFNPVFFLVGLLSALGMIFFGVSILTHKAYAAWTGMVLVSCPILASAIIALDGSQLFTNIPNIAMASAFIAIGIQALRAKERGQEVD